MIDTPFVRKLPTLTFRSLTPSNDCTRFFMLICGVARPGAREPVPSTTYSCGQFTNNTQRAELAIKKIPPLWELNPRTNTRYTQIDASAHWPIPPSVCSTFAKRTFWQKHEISWKMRYIFFYTFRLDFFSLLNVRKCTIIFFVWNLLIDEINKIHIYRSKNTQNSEKSKNNFCNIELINSYQ